MLEDVPRLVITALLRKQLTRAGHDAGAETITWHLTNNPKSQPQRQKHPERWHDSGEIASTLADSLRLPAIVLSRYDSVAGQLIVANPLS